MASYEVYMNHGNSSSATIFSVMNTLRQSGSKDAREDVVACAFGMCDYFPSLVIIPHLMKTS